MFTLDGILDALTLDQVAPDRYRASNVQAGHNVVFGGQLLAQSIAAALAEHDGKTVKTLHTVFTRSASPDTPVDITVERVDRSQLPDLGRDTAGDSTGLAGRAADSEPLQKAERKQGLPQPSGGRKEYTDDDGTVSKVVEWFGYKLHLLVDVKHEVVLTYEVTDTKLAFLTKIVTAQKS